MKIIRITTTKTAQERTERAFYNLDFTMTDGALERVVATVYTPESRLDSDPAPVFIGTITYENGQIFCSLPKGRLHCRSDGRLRKLHGPDPVRRNG